AVINCARASDTEAIWLAVERMMLILVAFGIVQAIFLPNFAFIVYPDARESYDFDSQRHRLVSTILEPNVAAGMIIMVLLVQMARLATGARQAMWKPFLLFAGLVATLSRGGMLAFVVGGVALMLIRGVNRRLLKFGAAITGVFLLSLPYLIPYAIANNRLTVSDNSAMARVMVWQRALSTFADYPWFGIGFNTYGFVQERRGFQRMGGAAYSVEGGLLFVMVLTGIVGLAVYLTMLWLALRRARAAWRRPEATANERGLLIGTAVATIAVLVDSVFVNSLMTPWLMEPLWILWGLAFLIATDIKRRRFPPTA
ncbi:MAG TPA: O-antigen ligase family protein, partial [Gemmatimonadaceae bacterium]|nr:O-antigen ligase family protein [Gemmatimonadaceae bacterium]